MPHCQFDYRYCHIDHLIDSHFDYSLMSILLFI
ncbi:transcriptional regulator [Escherichia coli O45:H2 str. 2010C-4211]|nr:transcriptional regulator [Escherichia coli O78:H12 str. 00-3279]KDV57714.1 transcriptional regulator [Escherichia coli O45:H2 str. 2010C-4211]